MALLCWEASSFVHLLVQCISEGWNLRSLGQEDTSSLPFGPFQAGHDIHHRTSVSEFSLATHLAGTWLGLLTQVLTGAGACSTQAEWMGFPRHDVDSHGTPSQGHLALRVLSPKNVLLELVGLGPALVTQ